MKKRYTITETSGNGMTVKEYVRNVLGMSAGTLRNMKYKGSITVDGENVYSNYVLKSGQLLCLETVETPSETVLPENIPMEILYEDDDFLAVNKPFGMASHPTLTHKTGTLAGAVMYYFLYIPFTFRLLTRLDADTSGVCLIAKNAASAGAFAHDLAQKEYLALCVGTPTIQEGMIDKPIARHPESIIKRRIDASGKPSQTFYSVLSEREGICLVRAKPLTGRTHQIRLHLASIGLPLYGDFLYGTEIPGERTRLHCEKLSFVHPMTKQRVHIVAPMPSDFEVLV